MKLIYQKLSLLALTTVLINPILSKVEAAPISANPRILYLAKKVSAQDMVNRAIARAQSGDNQGAIADLTAAIEMDKDLAVATTIEVSYGWRWEINQERSLISKVRRLCFRNRAR